MVNVLCLHGCCQTQKMFADILEPYVRLGKKQNVNFFFCEAKYDHPRAGKTWLSVPLELSSIGVIEYPRDLCEEVFFDIDEMIQQHDISILLGFSQGANMVDTYCQYRRNPQIKKVIIMSGYSFVDPNRTLILIPALIVNSKGDEIVPKDLSPRDYILIKEIVHDKGHKIPVKAPIVREILDFCVT